VKKKGFWPTTKGQPTFLLLARREEKDGERADGMPYREGLVKKRQERDEQRGKEVAGGKGEKPSYWMHGGTSLQK